MRGKNMFKKLSPLDIFIKVQMFLDLRELDIEEVRAKGKEDHSDFKEWMSMLEREEILKGCVSRLMYAE